jgi:hypothetical protein
MASFISGSLNYVEWMWKPNSNPSSESQPVEWGHYSDVENLLIEEAYSKKERKAKLDDYYIDFENNLENSITDHSKQRSIQRFERNREEQHLREDRFIDLEGGWVWVWVNRS